MQTYCLGVSRWPSVNRHSFPQRGFVVSLRRRFESRCGDCSQCRIETWALEAVAEGSQPSGLGEGGYKKEFLKRFKPNLISLGAFLVAAGFRPSTP